jgi:hypothetical protein
VFRFQSRDRKQDDLPHVNIMRAGFIKASIATRASGRTPDTRGKETRFLDLYSTINQRMT